MDEYAAQTIAKMAQGAIQPTPVQVEGYKELVALPEHITLYDLDSYLEMPRRIDRELVVTDVESFCRYWDKWNDESSVIYADVKSREVRAIFDEHIIDEHDETGSHHPRWLNHWVQYQCPLSREWLAWEDNDKAELTQIGFAEFLEDRISEIIEPSGLDLQEIITNFKLKRDVNFDSAISLKDGGVQLKYNETNSPMMDMEMPDTIKIAIPPFHNGTVYNLHARLRYRVNNGNLVIRYELIEPWRVLEHAFCAPYVEGTEAPKSVCAQVEMHTHVDINYVEMETVT